MSENPDIPQSTKKDPFNLGCSSEDFIAYFRLGWGNCRSKLTDFAGNNNRFSEEYIDGQLAKFDTLEAMPSLVQRNAVVTAAKDKMLAAAQAVRDRAYSFRNKIEFAFEEPSMVKTETLLSGTTTFLAKSATNWAAYPSYMAKAKTYLTEKLGFLVEKGLANPDIITQFEKENTSYKNAYSVYKEKEQTAKDDMKAQRKLIEELKADGNFMLKTGQEIYKYSPAELAFFIRAKLLAKVRGLKPAGLRGKATLTGTKKPFEGVSVSTMVEGEDTERTTLTDAKGDYLLKVPEGTYDFKFRSGSELLYTLSGKKIRPGIKSRCNVALQPAQE